ncbi:LAETG motif-containing sortase-dependent surface protein [Streptomyces bugieae]|uniref:LAETG motif-containing sortase-dependent surface protein n=1 Tax=Streptomyces bugieae TaxID=3098223 RepID=A0ABU7NUC5_9ACTN|nr:LAETG motif-containing sortase-dependent surface protein [Streptomyces sp. DSM 41528]
MTHPIRPRRQRALGRTAIALACAGILSLTGLPSLQGTADAAPKPPTEKKQELCEDMFGLQHVPPTPIDKIPWNKPVRPSSEWDEYFFDSQRQAMDGVILPGDTPAEQQKFLNALEHGPEGYKEGDPRKVWASYKRFLDDAGGKNKFGSFHNWLNESYLEMAARGGRGRAFHKKVVQDLGLTGPDWYCEENVQYTDKDGNKRYRRYDAVNYKTGDRVEIKSGGNHTGGQRPKDQAVLRADPKVRLRPIFGQEQTDETRKMYDKLSKEFGNGPDGRPRIIRYEHRSTYHARYKPGRFSNYDPYMNPNPGKFTGSRGGGNDQINRSVPTPKEAKEQFERGRRLGNSGQRVRGPGGVDFTTLELKYVGKPVKGQGMDYSFSAKKADEETNPGYGGKAKAQLISDAFFTWLALTPEKFWVNLNPDQPDKIMDSKFGKTDAGRVLLEADLQMKHDFYKAMDPKTDLGKRYWAALPKENGKPCMPGLRNWIEPKPAKVREQDGGIYILDAPLGLKSTAQKTVTQGPGEPICDPDQATIKRAQAVIDRMIVPAVEKTINTAPQYADLRRVYTSRVAAEWIRRQDAKAPTDYRKIINSGDVAKWPLRAPNQKWTREGVFNRYVKIFKEGEFRYEVPTGGTTQIYIVGGVDFSKSPKRNITRLRFQAQHRNLPRTTQTSVHTMTDDAENQDTLFLGGNTAAKATGDGSGDKPTPTPTPTHTGKPGEPSTPPATHTPDPGTSTPPTGDGGASRPPTNGPGGDLAHTGSDTPVGLIAGTAAALVAAGGGLMWWMRRRKAAPES